MPHETVRASANCANANFEVDLKAGLNVLVFKVVQLLAGWQGSVRFTDSDGQPVQGSSPLPMVPCDHGEEKHR
jgi:hypothetical protein